MYMTKINKHDKKTKILKAISSLDIAFLIEVGSCSLRSLIFDQ